VLSTPADQLYRDLTPEQIAHLPRYKGELLMTRHGTGCYTSMAAMKRWNRQNEQLIDAAERASVAADWLGGAAYPREALTDIWVRFLWHHFHDDLTGTSIPQAYTFSWNDELICLNQSAGILSNAVGAIARAMDTRVEGVPLVVYNPLAFERYDLVEATVRFAEGVPAAVRVFDPEGNEVPCGFYPLENDTGRVVLRARVPSVGWTVFDVRPVEVAEASGMATRAWTMPPAATVTQWGLETVRYRVQLNENGDVASIFDKLSQREALSSPIRLALFHNRPTYWSEWEVRYEDIAAEPYAYVGGPAVIRVVEENPARVVIEVERHAEGSTFVQRISLAGLDARERLEFDTRVDWHTPGTLLKVVFPLSVSNPLATYDLGFGVIERPTNTEPLYEVPAQQWADLTDADGSFGVSILNDCKYGWDKPDDHTLRLTLIHTPNDVEKDMGWHRFTYALVSHARDWRQGRTIEQAALLNQPLRVFQTMMHDGPLGRSFSWLKVSPGAPGQMVVRAVKKAEASDEVIVRLQESFGQPVDEAVLELASPIVSAREVTGAEKPVTSPAGSDSAATGRITPDAGKLRLSFAPFQARTLALSLAPPSEPARVGPITSAAKSVPLPFDVDGVTADGQTDGDFDGAGHSYPAELWPAKLIVRDIPYELGPTTPGAPNALACRGQELELPSGDFNNAYLLAAAVTGPQTGALGIGDSTVALTVHDFTGFIGQSDSLVVDGKQVTADRMTPGFINRDPVAWVGTHRHDAAGANELYRFCYLFQYTLPLPTGATKLRLPDNDRIRVMALTVARNPNDDTYPAQPLYDGTDPVYIEPRGGLFIEPARVTLSMMSDGTRAGQAGVGRVSPAASAAKIVYTLDGSIPQADSPVYTGPIPIQGDTTLVARTLRHGVLGDRFTQARFEFTTPRAPDLAAPANLEPGLLFRSYQGEWRDLPDFDTLTPVNTRSVSALDITLRPADNHYGLTFTGYVQVPRDGVYTFYTTSDDGSRLTIGDPAANGVIVVDNGGLHGKQEHGGRIALAAGLHALRVEYFERGGDDLLEVAYEGPGIDKQPLPAGALFHSPSSNP